MWSSRYGNVGAYIKRGVMDVISDLQIRENEKISGPPVLYMGRVRVL